MIDVSVLSPSVQNGRPRDPKPNRKAMTKPAKPSQGPKYRRLQYVADKLDLSPRSVQRLIAAGELPAVKIGGAVRVSDDELQRLIARSRLPNVSEG